LFPEEDHLSSGMENRGQADRGCGGCGRIHYRRERREVRGVTPNQDFEISETIVKHESVVKGLCIRLEMIERDTSLLGQSNPQ